MDAWTGIGTCCSLSAGGGAAVALSLLVDRQRGEGRIGEDDDNRLRLLLPIIPHSLSALIVTLVISLLLQLLRLPPLTFLIAVFTIAVK